MNTLKKIYFITVLFFLLEGYSQSGKVCGYTLIDFNFDKCLLGYTNIDLKAMNQNLTSSILEKVGIPNANFITKSCPNTYNAAAVFYNNHRYIILDEQFLYTLSKKAGNTTYWNNMFVIAHEIAHHLYGHTHKHNNSNAENQREELECDKFAGLVLRKFGATLQNVQNAVYALPEPPQNSTHPSRERRYQSAKEGYEKEKETEKQIAQKYKEEFIREYRINNKIKQIKEAREAYWDFRFFKGVSKENEKELEKIVQLYQIALSDLINDFDSRFVDELYDELSEVYEGYNSLENAYLYKKRAYEYNSKSEYLISLWDLCDRLEDDCPEYTSKMKLLNEMSIFDNNLLKKVGTFHAKNGNYNKAISVFKKAIASGEDKILNKKGVWQNDIPLLSDVYSDLSTTYLRLEDYINAYKNIQKSLELIDKYPSSFDNEVTYKKVNITNSNIEAILENKALIEVRLKLWDKCLASCKRLRDKNPTSLGIKNGTISYFEGRAYYGLQKYQEAITAYTDAIRNGNKNNYHFLYYYRAEAYLGLGDKEQAKLDLRISCDFGAKYSCEDLKKM